MLKNKKKVAIIGGSATSCLYALFLKSKNYDVTIFEASNNMGGAWGIDKKGAKYSNIIYPLTNNEKKIYKKSIIYLKRFGVKFKMNYQKSLFSKKVVNAMSCDLKGLYDLTYSKIKIKKNYRINSIFEGDKYVLLNKKYSFDYVFFPTYIKLKSLYILQNKRKKKISIPFLKMNKALHLRIIVSNLLKEKYDLKKLTLGSLDRFQILKLEKNLSQINGRVLLDWKNKPKKMIINEICKTLIFDKIISYKFYIYRSCIRDKKQIQNLKKQLSLTKKIKYLETFTLLEFLRVNVFNNIPLRKFKNDY